MRKQLIGLLIFFFFGTAVVSAQKMSDIFVRIPDSLVQTLDKTSRTTLIDFWGDNDKKAVVQNSLGGMSELKDLGDNYVLLQTSEGNTVEIKLLPINEYYNILCLINTSCAPACDSRISFYTTEWKPLKNTYIQPITASGFYIPGNSDCADLTSTIDMHPIKLSLNKDNSKLTAFYSIESYLNKEDFEKLKPCLKGELSFDWVDGRYMQVAE
jgi:hypothetical protein